MATNYIQNELIENLKQDNADYVRDLADQLEKVALGKEITSALEAQASELDNAIKNQKEYIARYQRVRAAAQQLINKVKQEL
ncbi:hypothetical protein A6A19_01155 [Actinobacillus delphinicola]|uniref:hypothetical protein n=1 Tax=Actinobacillus delphinicola TaxID=51161 RepID=UPI002441CD9A|nr:hypothetical protein [Actinobacillus delphinicola]MDG6896637.1 hypothetical protein [Actinobacillus delphinicola]